MRYKPVLKQILKDITPSKEERTSLSKGVKSFISDLNKSLKKLKISASAVIGGSYSKDTWLTGDYDVDIFVKFKPKHKDEDLSNLLERALKKWKHERIHGSRDYFWIRNHIKFEIVPVLDIKKPEQSENVTDFSPWHVDWVNKKGKKLKDDIRLTKQFCKAARCYGSESYIRGFSGHVVDILTIYYKGFIPLLKAATKWKPKTVLDYNKTYKGQALMMINKSKTAGPLLIVDPLQPARNSAAALTEENFNKFIKAAKTFLKKPSKNSFVEKEINFKTLEKQGHLIKIQVKPLKDKEDVAGTKFVRAFEYLESTLQEFKVKKSGWLWDKKDKGLWYFVLKNKLLPKDKLWKGPPVKIEIAVKEFKKKYKKSYVKGGRLWTKITVKERTPEQVIKRVIKSSYIKARVRGIKL